MSGNGLCTSRSSHRKQSPYVHEWRSLCTKSSSWGACPKGPSQMGKLRHGDLKQLASSYTASKWQSQAPSPGRLGLVAVAGPCASQRFLWGGLFTGLSTCTGRWRQEAGSCPLARPSCALTGGPPPCWVLLPKGGPRLTCFSVFTGRVWAQRPLLPMPGRCGHWAAMETAWSVTPPGCHH